MNKSTTVALSPEQQEQIRSAVATAEGNTSGEIVPLIISSADSYAATTIRYSAFLMMLITVTSLWFVPACPIWAISLIMVGSYLGCGLILTQLPAVLRKLIANDEMDERVNDKAFSLFIHHGLHYTRDATGVLILISLFEKRVQILADRGINEKVSHDQWQHAVDSITKGLHDDNMVPALCDAIDQCGHLLAEHCPRRDDDTNELPDLIIH
ncbi:MAG: TPM domain-containing protein [Desulfuromonas sp.]|nr:TPM domain-containing protein [Desulfuromonas sp.]